MIANVRCLKCGATGKFDVGNKVSTIEEAQALLNGAHIQSCPFGNHIELSDIKYTAESLEEGEAGTDEDALAKLESKGHVCWTDTAKLREDGVEITSFAYGFPMANIGGQNLNLDFTSLPSGKRVWYCSADEYAKLTGATIQSVEA
jgi:hypothetical protein